MKYSALLLLFAALLALTSAESSSNATEDQSSSRQARFDERKFRFDQDKKELSQFLNTKNIVKTVVKLLFGSTEESSATSRQVLNVLVKVLDMLKSSFGQRARTSASRGIRDSIDDAAVAGISMLKGYVRSVLTTDEHCTQKHICEAAARASREGRDMGYLVAQVGGYGASYILESQKSVPFNVNYEASRQGRNGADCAKLYKACNEAD